MVCWHRWGAWTVLVTTSKGYAFQDRICKKCGLVKTRGLSLPEDEDAYNTARNGPAYLAIINGLRDALRDKIKYNPPKSKEANAILDELWEKLFSLASEEGVTIW